MTFLATTWEWKRFYSYILNKLSFFSTQIQTKSSCFVLWKATTFLAWVGQITQKGKKITLILKKNTWGQKYFTRDSCDKFHVCLGRQYFPAEVTFMFPSWLFSFPAPTCQLGPPSRDPWQNTVTRSDQECAQSQAFQSNAGHLRHRLPWGAPPRDC